MVIIPISNYAPVLATQEACLLLIMHTALWITSGSKLQKWLWSISYFGQIFRLTVWWTLSLLSLHCQCIVGLSGFSPSLFPVKPHAFLPSLRCLTNTLPKHAMNGTHPDLQRKDTLFDSLEALLLSQWDLLWSPPRPLLWLCGEETAGGRSLGGGCCPLDLLGFPFWGSLWCRAERICWLGERQERAELGLLEGRCHVPS